VSSLPSTDDVDCSYRWRPLRHGRGAESDPAAVPGAAAVSAVDGSGAGGVGWLTADLAAEACAFHLTWSRQRGHRPGHQLA
jgi:hypothetical protein